VTASWPRSRRTCQPDVEGPRLTNRIRHEIFRADKCQTPPRHAWSGGVKQLGWCGLRIWSPGLRLRSSELWIRRCRLCIRCRLWISRRTCGLRKVVRSLSERFPVVGNVPTVVELGMKGVAHLEPLGCPRARAGQAPADERIGGGSLPNLRERSQAPAALYPAPRGCIPPDLPAFGLQHRNKFRC
jgi:hypothetical protein